MKKYTIKTKFIFCGEFYIEADNKAQAKEFVSELCGLVLGGGIQTSLPDEVVDWDFTIHPDTIIR